MKTMQLVTLSQSKIRLKIFIYFSENSNKLKEDKNTSNKVEIPSNIDTSPHSKSLERSSDMLPLQRRVMFGRTKNLEL